ncbi:MAG: HEAT repeat domain-containing protein, partial [Deltaproteobacteria bacterium]|nr:HEAT repeat domain-containing protein [Deltaproteobacteria bacterium]
PEEAAPVYAVPFEGEARGAAPAAAGAFEAEPAEPAPLGGEARGAEPAAARLVEGESRVRIDLDAGEDLEPVVVDEDLDMEPAIAGEALDIPAAYPLRPTRPIEQRVRIEDLGEDGFTAVDTELGVVSVDTEAGFAPPVSAPAETGSESSPYLLVKQKPGLPELERMESGMPVLLDELCCGDRLRMAAARERLSAQGASVLPQVMTRFPGHLLHDARARQEDQPALVEHSELLHLLVDLGADICPHVVERLEDPDPITRYYAVKILDEVHCTRAVARLSGRLYDRDALVRLAAIDVLQGYRKTTGFRFLLKSLRNRLQSGEPAQQAVSAALLGNFKDAEALPALVDLLGAEDKMVARAALESLSYISKQQFGSSDRKWRKWLDAHRSERRIQWLVAGLRSADRDIRFSSAQELRSLTGQRFGYDFDAPKADREKAARQWERWWEDRGQHLSFED